MVTVTHLSFSAGGVELLAQGHKFRIDNTLDKRLELISQQVKYTFLLQDNQKVGYRYIDIKYTLEKMSKLRQVELCIGVQPGVLVVQW